MEEAPIMDSCYEEDDLKEFIDLLKRMLAVNAADQIKPENALKHNFITMKHLPINSNDSYVKNAVKIMSECQLRTSDESTDNCNPDPAMTTDITNPAPTVVPPEKEVKPKKTFRRI